MFNQRRTLVGIVTFLTVLITSFIAWKSGSEYGTQFWYTLASVWLSEILLGFVCSEILNPDERAIPMMLGHLTVGILYFIFALIGVFVLTDNVSDTALISTHAIVLLIVLILHILLGMANSSFKKSDAQHSLSLVNKRLFSVKLVAFKGAHAEWLASNAELNKKIDALTEDVKFASDSVPGLESIDNRIMDLFEQMNCADSAENAAALADSVKTALAERNATAKILR